jgi:predicted aspartyl protease
MVRVRLGGKEVSLLASVDTGCPEVLFKGEELEPLGWQPMREGDPSRKTFSGAAEGAKVTTSPVTLVLTLPDEVEFELTAYVADHGTLRRNLLGCDLLRRAIVGVDDETRSIYLSSLQSANRDELIRDVD